MIARFEGHDFGSEIAVRDVPTYYPGTPIVPRGAARHCESGTGGARHHGRARSSVDRHHPWRCPWFRPDLRGPTHSRVGARDPGVAEGYHAMTTASSDGSFTIAGLLPGTYLITAQSMLRSEFASKEVVVEGSDLAGVTLLVSQGATARGRITFDTGKPPQELRPSQIFVGAMLLDSERGDGYERAPTGRSRRLELRTARPERSRLHPRRGLERRMADEVVRARTSTSPHTPLDLERHRRPRD